MKKFIAMLLVPIMLVLWSAPNDSYAANHNTTTIENGHLQNGRVFIPLRVVSERLGSTVRWNQETKEVTIIHANGEIVLKMDATTAMVNGNEVSLDAPAQLVQGTTFVPLRFVSQALGANIDWNQQERQATVTLEAQRVVVNATSTAISVPRRMTEQQIATLYNKLNEATDLSSFSQIRTHFRPYFTDRFINKIIQQNGLEYNQQVSYRSGLITYTTHTQARISNSGLPLDSDDFYDYLTRTITVIYTSDGWKIDDIHFQIENDRHMMN